MPRILKHICALPTPFQKALFEIAQVFLTHWLRHLSFQAPSWCAILLPFKKTVSLLYDVKEHIEILMETKYDELNIHF